MLQRASRAAPNELHQIIPSDSCSMTCGKWVGGLSPVPSGQVSTAQKLPSQLGLISNLVVAATGKPGAHVPTVLWEAWLDIRWCAPKVQCRNAHRGPCKKCCCFRRNRTAPRTALHFSPDSPKPEMSESGMRFKVLFQPTEWTCLWHLKCYVIPPFIRAIDATATQNRFPWIPNCCSKCIPSPLS